MSSACRKRGHVSSTHLFTGEASSAQLVVVLKKKPHSTVQYQTYGRLNNGPVPISQQDTYCPGHISQQDTCWHSLTQYCPTLYTCLTHIQAAVKLCLVQMALRHQIKKSAYFPGEKITRTQMLVRVFTKWITWLTISHPTGNSQHLGKASSLNLLSGEGWCLTILEQEWVIITQY